MRTNQMLHFGDFEPPIESGEGDFGRDFEDE